MGTTSWDLDAGSGGSKAEFTKFPVGVTRIRVVDDAPFIRWTHWMPQFKRSVNCPGVKICPIDDIISKQKANGEKPTYNATRRYAINVYNHETGNVEIMEQGKTFFEDLKIIMDDLRGEGKTLQQVDLKVRRTGTGKDDTKYRIDVQGDDDLPASAVEKIKNDVTDLQAFFKPHTPEQITRILNGEDWAEVMKQESDSEDDGDIGEEIEIK